jgi:hypothetical protein
VPLFLAPNVEQQRIDSAKVEEVRAALALLA